MSTQNRFAVVFALVCVVLHLPVWVGVGACAETDPSVVISMATGPTGGTYAEIGEVAATIAGAFGLRLDVVTTDGSWDNLLRLDSGLVQVALAQQDAVSEYLRYRPESPIRVARPLYADYLHILVRSQFSIRRASQLEGLRIFVGLPRSGTALTSRNLFDLLGISAGQYAPIQVDRFDRVAGMFRGDSLDAAMYVGSLRNRHVESLMRSRTARLLSLDADALRAIAGASGSQVGTVIHVATIPVGAYDNQGYDVRTVSVPVLLLVLKEMPRPIMRRVSSLVDSAIAAVAASGNQGLLAPVPDAHFQRSLPLHDPSSVRTSRPFWQRWSLLLILLPVLLLSIWFAHTRRLRVYAYFRPHLGRVTLGFILILILASTIGAYIFESPVNDKFSNLFEAGWSIVVYLLSGMEDRVPYTAGGRFFCLLALALSPLLIALVTGLIASALVVRNMEVRMTKQLSDHYVIVNWNRRAFEIVRQVHSPKLGKSVITVISDDPTVNFKSLESQFRRTKDRCFEDVYFCPGDPSTEHVLLNANVEEAAVVIVMSDDREEDSDEKGLRILFLIKGIAERFETTVDVVIELRNMANYTIVRELKKTFPGTLDYVAAGHMRTLVIAQCALNPGMSEVYRDLLSTTDDTCELYTVDLPSSAAGKTFSDYVRDCVAVASDKGVIPVGVGRRVGGVLRFSMSPLPTLRDGAQNPFHVLCPDDKLLVIAYDPPRTEELPA